MEVCPVTEAVPVDLASTQSCKLPPDLILLFKILVSGFRSFSDRSLSVCVRALFLFRTRIILALKVKESISMLFIYLVFSSSFDEFLTSLSNIFFFLSFKFDPEAIHKNKVTSFGRQGNFPFGRVKREHLTEAVQIMKQIV